MTVEAAADPAPAQSDEVLSTHAHVLGNVPVASVRADVINGDPDITTNTRPPTSSCTRDAGKRTPIQQTPRCPRPSSSCATSGVVIQTLPRTRAQIPDDRFRHILRLRMGVPCATIHQHRGRICESSHARQHVEELDARAVN